MWIRLVLGTFIAVLMASAAQATTYKFSATGTVGNPYSVDRNFQPVSTFATSIRAGDKFAISFDINPGKFGVTSLYNSDPTINIYYGTVSYYQLSIGDYGLFIPGDVTFASSQLWNNFVSAGSPVDHFGLSALQAISASAAPITLTSQVVNQVFGFSAFDFTATTRSSDLITEIGPLTGFSSKSAFVGFIDPNNYDQTTYSINGLTASITPVPEPATWLMMVIGVAFAGQGMRRAEGRRRQFDPQSALG